MIIGDSGMKRFITASYILLFSPTVFAAAAYSDSMDDMWAKLEAHCHENICRARSTFNRPVRTEFQGCFVRCDRGFNIYDIAETQSYIWALTQPLQRQMLLERFDFLIRLFLSYRKEYFEDFRAEAGLSEEPLFFQRGDTIFNLFQVLAKIVDVINNEDHVRELDVTQLYRSIKAGIYEINSRGTLNKKQDGLLNLYQGIEEWVDDFFPKSHMYKYLKYRFQKNMETRKFDIICAFQGGLYYNDYFKNTREYKRIQEALVNQDECFKRDVEFRSFCNKVFAPFDQNSVPEGVNLEIAMIRFMENIYNEGEALLEKWIDIIDAEKEESERLAQEKATARAAKILPKKIDPKAALTEMMRSLGIEDDSQPSKASSKAKKTTKPNSIPKESKTAMERQHQAAERARALCEVEETERLAQLEEITRQNAEKKAALESRQAGLRERREQERLQRRRVMDGLLQRKVAWVESLYAETQKLPVYNSSELIDPAIFLGQSDYQTVIDALRAASIYIKEHIHGNEKCVAMWKDSDGKNKMVWFDAPHGVQVSKGAAAGWVISLQKALKESGRLLSR
jgi:hypothetical protein